MKNLFIALFTLCLAPAIAQDGGMNFLHAANWKEVLATAQKENKYIFVDAYTTWCGPCKYMAANIFPMENVGKFYNENFINVKVQLDTTKKDDDFTKSWYADAHYIMTNYKVQVFPTYLFLDSKGKLVHRAVGSSEAEQFIGKGRDALDPTKQYYTLKDKYDAGDRDPAFLYQLAMASLNAYDMENSKQFVETYAATQTDMLTEKNIELLQAATQSTNDVGFAYMLKYPEKFNVAGGKGYAESTTRFMIMREEIMREMFANKKGEPDWNSLQAKIDKKYPERSKEIISYSKVFYYQNSGDWDKFSVAVNDFMQQYGNGVPYNQMNSFAWSVFQNCNDPACVANAINWSLSAAEAKKDPSYYDTYANLLFKSGKQNEAIAAQEQAIALAKAANNPSISEFEETLEKIKKGEKTWN